MRHVLLLLFLASAGCEDKRPLKVEYDEFGHPGSAAPVDPKIREQQIRQRQLESEPVDKTT